ncbi:uncharacterized protein LOC127149777 isoform X2 [Cucumis melo]|uniref:Uncharacterized protein LOC103504428 isoform X3 n=1 Tax=Cucumis melo TaxID=3656 RepID=A0ABM3KJ28_CUCME|nr:uncharacterized protein LOC103504428 isoform X3 [Cucumis melo]XP_050941610.1 uncharacterized protein LOC127149777 isoform X2 [Cucumis melo]
MEQLKLLEQQSSGRMARSSSTLQTVGYSFFAAIFNVGWAATQVSHMSMVNCITLNSTSRVALASCRNAFNMVANLSLYAVALLVFSITKAKSHTDIEYQGAITKQMTAIEEIVASEYN